MRKCWALFGLGLLLITLAASAQPPVSPVKVVRVGIQEIDYYPHFDFSSQPPQGYFYDLMQLFAKQAKLRIEFVPLPVRRLYQEAADSVDLVYPDNPRWQRYLVVNLAKHYSAPVEMNLGTTMVLAQNRDMPLAKVRSVAIIHGFTPTKWLELESQYRYRLVEVADVDSALGLVLKGRVDAAVVEYHVAQHYMQQHKLQDQLVVGSQLPYTQLAFLLSSFRDESLIQQFNLFLQKNAVEVDALRQKYHLYQQLPEPHQPE